MPLRDYHAWELFRNPLKFNEFGVKREETFEAGSHHVVLPGLELTMQTMLTYKRSTCLSASLVLGLKLCTTMHGKREGNLVGTVS